MMRSTLRSWLVLPLLGASLTGLGCGDDDDGDGGDGGNPTGGGGDSVEITASNAAVVQAALGQTLSQVIALGPGRHDGDSGSVTISISKPAQNINYTMDFDGYSADGELFIDGDLTYQIDTVAGSVHYFGDLEFSGTYSGSVEMDIQAGATGASGTYTVNGQTISI